MKAPPNGHLKNCNITKSFPVKLIQKKQKKTRGGTVGFYTCNRTSPLEIVQLCTHPNQCARLHCHSSATSSAEVKAEPAFLSVTTAALELLHCTGTTHDTEHSMVKQTPTSHLLKYYSFKSNLPMMLQFPTREHVWIGPAIFWPLRPQLRVRVTYSYPHKSVSFKTDNKSIRNKHS